METEEGDEDADEKTEDKTEEKKDEKKDEKKEEKKEDKKDEKKEEGKKNGDKTEEQRVQAILDEETKRLKDAEQQYELKRTIDEKVRAFAATRNYNEFVLEGFLMDERDHIVRLCRRLGLRSYTDKMRTENDRMVYYVFLSQIIPIKELVTALKKTKDGKLGKYTLLPPKEPAEVAAAEKSDA